jgi:hypothetical protein
VSGQLLCLTRFTLGERAPGIRWIGGWVGPIAGLDEVEKRKFLTPPGLELRSLSRPARRQSLYGTVDVETCRIKRQPKRDVINGI